MGDAAAFATASNIQGALHVGAPLGRKRKLKKDAPRTLYVNRPVLNAPEIIAWAKANGFAKAVTPDDMHVTVAFSKAEIEWPTPSPLEQLVVPPDDTRTIARFGPEKNCIVLCFDYPELKSRWRELRDAGASWDWPDYQPHITLSYNGYNGNDLAPATMRPYTGPIVLGPEEFDEVTEGWGDNIVEKSGARHSKTDRDLVQNMHDHAVALGASCGMEKRALPQAGTICKVDEDERIVWGWASVATIKGEPVVDLQNDTIDAHTLAKAATEFMLEARKALAMHTGEPIGVVVHSMPLTDELAKSLGIGSEREGWLVGVKVIDEGVWKRVKSKELQAFSIGGQASRVAV